MGKGLSSRHRAAHVKMANEGNLRKAVRQNLSQAPEQWLRHWAMPGHWAA